jgi:GTPase SAR1 family protein
MPKDINADNFFVPVQNTKPYLKIALEGESGCGKTYTGSLIAIGLHKKIGSTKPVIIFDTETSSKFLKPLFESAGIELWVKDSRSMADLKETMTRIRQGASDILIIDSITHIWEDFLSSYLKGVRRDKLQFQDWGVVKPRWREEFSTPFVRDKYHIIMTGRAKDTYETEINSDSGKREIFKSGIDMAAEKNTAYEPDILVMMTKEQTMRSGKVTGLIRRALILKDRSDMIDGKVFEMPTFKEFEAPIDLLLKKPVDRDKVVGTEANSSDLFKDDKAMQEQKVEHKKWLEELQGTIKRIYPSNTGPDRSDRLSMLEFVFGTTSETAIDEMSVEQLKKGIREIIEVAVERGLVEYVERDGKKKWRRKREEIKI